MAWKNVMVTCWMVFFIIGCFLWSPHLFAVEAEKAKAGKTKKPFAVVQNKTVSANGANGANGAPCSALETSGRTRFDFDNLTFEVGRFIMDLGEARLVVRHRWGTLSPAFDGVHFMMGNTDQKWSLRVFGARPVQRDPTSLNWNTPETYFSGAYVTNRDLRWVNFDGYFFQLNESDKLRQRNLSTTGFRLFAHRHHGKVVYSFNTPMPLRAL